MVAGNAKETLSRPHYALVSDKVARQIGGDVVGKTFVLDAYDKYPITIGGIFEEYPENSTENADIYISLASLKSFFSLYQAASAYRHCIRRVYGPRIHG